MNNKQQYLRCVVQQVFIIGILLISPPLVLGKNVVLNDINHVLSDYAIMESEFLLGKILLFHGNDSKEPLYVSVRIFESENKYIEHCNQFAQAEPPGNAYFSIVYNEVVIYKSKNYFKSIIHEGQHCIFRVTFPKPPRWLNEGLSEFFETAYVSAGKAYVKPQKKKMMRLQTWLKNGELLSIQEFLSWSNRKWRRKNQKPENISSTMSWGMIYFFMSSNERKDILKRIFSELKNSKGDSLEIIDCVYEGGISVFEKEFHQFIMEMSAKRKIQF